MMAGEVDPDDGSRHTIHATIGSRCSVRHIVRRDFGFALAPNVWMVAKPLQCEMRSSRYTFMAAASARKRRMRVPAIRGG